MEDIIVSDSTINKINRFVKSPYQGLGIIGPQGLGKSLISKRIITSILDINSLENYPYFKEIDCKDKNNSGISAVRSIRDFLALSVPSNKDINRAVLINYAGELSIEAQNALLKVLEEPPKGTIIILTARSRSVLLPTILSRLQIIDVNYPTKDQLKKKFSNLKSQDFEKFYLLSNGNPGLMTELSADPSHPLNHSSEIVRSVLGSDLYTRLNMVDSLAKDKQELISLIRLMQEVARINLSRDAVGGNRWQKILNSSYLAEEDLNKNVQTKLVVLNLMLNV